MTAWSPEENQKLRDLMATGITTKMAAVDLGRTYKSVAAHWTEMNYSEQRRRLKREHDNLKRREDRYTEASRGNLRVPEEVLAERQAAMAQRMSLTGFVFGDPVPSRSALGRRAGA